MHVSFRSGEDLMSASRRTSRRSASVARRSLRLEPLEVRRMLSTVTVTTLNDFAQIDGQTSLREALAQANGGDTINFASTLSGSITLNGELHVQKNLTIEGRGASLIKIDGHDFVRGIRVDPGVTATIRNLSVVNGF